MTIAARYPEHKPAPVSGIMTQEIYTLFGSAAASEKGTRRLVGVAAQGMTACPCAQQIVAGHARERLTDDGFTDDEIERIFDAVPVATHNQRGLGTLHIGCPEGCDIEFEAATLLEIVEDSMSSEIYELMKRSDEGAVVEKAHRRPRFVEDCVREMIRGVVEPLRRAARRHLRLRPPGEPRDDPPAQRRRRALRHARRAAPRDRLRRAHRAPHVDARVARRRRTLTRAAARRREDVARLLDLDALIDALAAAMADLSAGRASAPPRIAAPRPRARRARSPRCPGHVPSLGRAATKLVTLFPRNGARGIPTHQA